MSVQKMIIIVAAFSLVACHQNGTSGGEIDSLVSQDTLQAKQDAAQLNDTLSIDSLVVDTFRIDNTQTRDSALIPTADVNTKSVAPDQIVRFAKNLIGTPYKYGSTDPKVGFDCSGFITYVFNHFGISVPRSSINFTNVGKEVSVNNAKPGDLILFTGTNPAERFVGHMGIVVANRDTLNFIHATSGKKYSVTITPLNDYYKGRFVKTIRVFPQNDQ